MNRVYDNRKSMLAGEEGEDSASKCRDRRRRRMAVRRVAVRGGGKAKKSTDNPTSQEIMNLISNMETPPPVYGTMSLIGRKREMVDEVSVQTNVCRPEINAFQPVHFFGVFDGHMSALCKEHMHVIVKEELMSVKVVGNESNGGERWRLVVNRSFQRMNEMSSKLCSSSICRCNPQLSLMGSTTVLTNEYMLVAKSGDSGDVICREGRPVDRKADVGGCGGRIMSRPIDEIGFWAASEPEISITKREPRDECLILGSNGLWDVVSSETACKTVHECLRDNANSCEGSELAATLLARLALGRWSADNISVIVVDLRK